jgi:GH18 family chitinase
MKAKGTNRFGKRLLFTAGLALFAFSTTQAQVSWHMGVTGGPQYNMMTSNYGSYDGKISFNGGLANEIRFGPHFSVEVDNVVSMLGGQRKYLDSLELSDGRKVMFSYNNSENLMYLQNILLLRYNLVLDGPTILPYDFEGPPRTWISIFAGPSYNMRIGYDRGLGTKTWQMTPQGDTLTDVTNYNHTPASIQRDIDSNYIQPDEIGLVVGAGINFRLGKKKTLGFEARYHKGMTSIDRGYFGQYYYSQQSGEGFLYRYADIFNSAISLNVSYKIRILGSKYE